MTQSLAGMRIGHAADLQHHTGCTVFLCPQGTVGSVDVRGPGPGSRETALLALDKPTAEVHAVVFTGGSAFGLAAADGVMRYLGERQLGHVTPVRPIPIVPAAVIYDLLLSGGRRMPDADMGYAACLAATEANFHQGNVGAGVGATVGKWGGLQYLMKGGFGLASHNEGDLVVTAAAVVNAIGDVVDASGRILAGARLPDGSWLADGNRWRYVPDRHKAGTNTTLTAVFSNARLSKVEANRLAQRAHDGLAQALRPAHMTHEGDTAFALSTGTLKAPFDLVANIATELVAEAIRNGVQQAQSVGSAPGLATGMAPE